MQIQKKRTKLLMNQQEEYPLTVWKLNLLLFKYLCLVYNLNKIDFIYDTEWYYNFLIFKMFIKLQRQFTNVVVTSTIPAGVVVTHTGNLMAFLGMEHQVIDEIWVALQNLGEKEH